MTSPSTRPDSPCVAICSTALGDDVCRGCGRTVQEVAMWVALPEAQKELIWTRLEQHWAARGLPPPWLARDKRG